MPNSAAAQNLADAVTALELAKNDVAHFAPDTPEALAIHHVYSAVEALRGAVHQLVHEEDAPAIQARES